jgi:hypothetical protein
MLKKLFLPAAASAALALSASCGETIVEPGKNPGNAAGSDTVTVSDTLAVSDTLTVSDTLAISDTIVVSDTVIVVDTLWVLDTVIVKDTVFNDPDLSGVSVTGLVHMDPDMINVTSIKALLRWNMIEGADYYRVFVKSSVDDSLYIAVDGFVDTAGYFYFERGQYTYNYIGNNVFTFAVQAVNSRSRSKLATVDVSAYLTLDYQYNRYKVPNDSVAVFSGYDSTASYVKERLRLLQRTNFSESDTAAILWVSFSEPVNTHRIRTKFEPEIPRLYMDETWSEDRTMLLLELIVLPGPAITERVNTIYTISGLRSQSGNDFIIGYDVNGERIIKNTLDFRFDVNPRGQ